MLLQHNNHIANENKAKNQANYRKWVESYTPIQIRQANNARAALSRSTKKQWRPLKDERQVKSYRNAYTFFSTERLGSGDFHGIKIPDAAKLIGREFKALPAHELKASFAHSSRSLSSRSTCQSNRVCRNTKTWQLRTWRDMCRNKRPSTTSMSDVLLLLLPSFPLYFDGTVSRGSARPNAGRVRLVLIWQEENQRVGLRGTFLPVVYDSALRFFMSIPRYSRKFCRAVLLKLPNFVQGDLSEWAVSLWTSNLLDAIQASVNTTDDINFPHGFPYSPKKKHLSRFPHVLSDLFEPS